MKRSLSLAFVPFLFPACLFALTLEEAVQHVSGTNPVILERVQNYKATAYDEKIGEAEFLPTIDVSIYTSNEKTRNVVTSQNDVRLTHRGKTFKAKANMFNGFGSMANIEQQKARVAAARENIHFTANSLTLETIEAYLNLMKEYEFLKIAQSNLATHKQINTKINERTQSGFGSKSEEDQSKSRLALAHSNAIIQRSNFRDARAKFERIYGKPVNVEEFVKPVFSHALPSTLDNAVEQAKSNHPALAVELQNVAAAEHRLGVAKKEFYPSLDLEIGIDDAAGAGGYAGEDYFKYTMLTLSYNLFNGQQDAHKKEQAQVKILQEKEVQADLIRRVEENVKYAWIAYEELTKQIPFLKQHRDYSMTTLDAYNKEFALGRRTLLDILNTENELTAAKKELTTAEYDLLLAQYRILEGTGELAKVMDVKPSF